MIQNKTIRNFKDFHPLAKKEKLHNVIIALNKIARDTGEHEYESLIKLEKEFNIIVKSEDIKELRGRYIWVWIIRPFNENSHGFLARKLKKLNLPLENYLKVTNFNNNKIIYPEIIENCRVHKEICEILKEQHKINSSYLEDFEWERIQNSKTWIKAQIQITREFVADKLLKKNFICKS